LVEKEVALGFYQIIAQVVLGVWVTVVATRSFLFVGIRNFLERWPILGYLASCPLCYGTWVGAILSLCLENKLIIGIPCTSLASYLFVSVIDYLEANSKWHVGVEEENLQKETGNR